MMVRHFHTGEIDDGVAPVHGGIDRIRSGNNNYCDQGHLVMDITVFYSLCIAMFVVCLLVLANEENMPR